MQLWSHCPAFESCHIRLSVAPRRLCRHHHLHETSRERNVLVLHVTVRWRGQRVQGDTYELVLRQKTLRRDRLQQRTFSLMCW